MSDDEDDVVVLQVCANNGCMDVEDLQFDEEAGELYCGKCRDLFSRAAKEGFHLLLSQDDIAVVKIIFAAFDKDKKNYWTWEDFNVFQDSLDKCDDDPLRSSAEMDELFHEEYDISLKEAPEDSAHAGQFVVTRFDLEDMYGGYLFNNIPALRDDSEALSDAGFINLGALE
jgi:hypothetical protein